MAYPTTRLKQFSIGDTVILKGAAIEKSSPLFIGGIEYGYYLLYRSQQQHQDGKFWEHAAAPDHEVVA